MWAVEFQNAKIWPDTGLKAFVLSVDMVGSCRRSARSVFTEKECFYGTSPSHPRKVAEMQREGWALPLGMDVASSIVPESLSSPATCHPIYFPNLFCWRLSETFSSFFSFVPRPPLRIRDTSADVIFKLRKQHQYNLLMLLFFFSHTCWEVKCVGIHENPNRAKGSFMRRVERMKEGGVGGRVEEEREERWGGAWRQKGDGVGDPSAHASSGRKKVFINLNCPHQPSSLVESSSQVFCTWNLTPVCLVNYEKPTWKPLFQRVNLFTRCCPPTALLFSSWQE